MPAIVVERRYRSPTSLDRIRAADVAAGWCIRAHDGKAVFHALDVSGQASICIYEAPDADAMRRVADVVGGRTPRIWASTAHWSPPGSPEPALRAAPGEAAIGLALREFASPTDFGAAHALEEEQGHCLALHRVRHLRSYLSLDGMRMLCLYAAPDLEAVRQANRLTGLPVAEVMAVMVRDPG